MTAAIDVLNRALVILVGLLLLAAGVLVLLLGFGVFGADRASLPVIDEATSEVGGATWFWPVAGAVAVLLAVLCLLWLVGQLRVRRLSTVDVDHTAVGDTRLSAGTLTAAIRQEAEQVIGVSRARARMIKNEPRPDLHLTVWLSEPYDLGEVRRGLEDAVVAHARDALGADTLRTWLHLEVDPPQRTRVS
ncbi:hypothetical protein BH20ACT5_BH20ACT5_02160 [soil metagenome]